MGRRILDTWELSVPGDDEPLRLLLAGPSDRPGDPFHPDEPVVYIEHDGLERVEVKVAASELLAFAAGLGLPDELDADGYTRAQLTTIMAELHSRAFRAQTTATAHELLAAEADPRDAIEPTSVLDHPEGGKGL